MWHNGEYNPWWLQVVAITRGDIYENVAIINIIVITSIIIANTTIIVTYSIYLARHCKVILAHW